MSSEKTFFDEQITYLRSLSSTYQYLNKNASFMDADTLLRAEFVLIVSAFDNYLHSVVRRKIRENFFAAQPLPQGCDLPIEICRLIYNEPVESTRQEILDSALRKSLEKDSFQSPRSVEYALSLISVNHLWKTSSPTIGDTPSHIRDRLALIVHRRNQIAHEADINYSTGSPRSIDIQTVTDCRNFLAKLVESIDLQIL